MQIAIDHGNKQIKLPGDRVFTSGLRESSTPPPFGEDVLKYKGKYYTISDKRIPFMRDKSVDDHFYILTLFAIAFEIEDMGRLQSSIMPIQLLVGLPPTHYGAQYERFEQYFKRGIEEFEFHEKTFRIDVTEVTAYPQAFAAAMPVYGQINTLSKMVVVDIGGGSLLLRKQIEASGKVASPIFVDKLSANARGYELLHRVARFGR